MSKDLKISLKKKIQVYGLFGKESEDPSTVKGGKA